MANDRREEIRVHFQGAAWYRTGKGSYQPTVIADLSEGGISLFGTMLIDGEPAEVVVRTRPGRYLNLKARPVWSRGHRIGLQFEPQASLKVAKYLGTQAFAQFSRVGDRRHRPRLRRPALSA